MTNTTFLKARAASLAASGQPPIAAFTIPIISGLVGAYLQSGGLAYLGRNYANWEDDATVTGLPVEEGRYIHFGVGAGLQTPHDETAAATLIFIGKKTSTGTPAFFMGSRLDAANGGISIFAATTNCALYVQTTTGDKSVSLPMTENWNIWMATVPATGGLFKLMNRTLDTSIVSTTLEPRAISGTDTYKIGDFTGSWDAQMLAALIYTRVLSSEELDTMEIWARAYAADFGIAV